jgi:hypothetical protein
MLSYFFLFFIVALLDADAMPYTRKGRNMCDCPTKKSVCPRLIKTSSQRIGEI